MLRYIKYFTIGYLLIILILCSAMNEQQNILDKLIPKDSYPEIEFITDDRIILNINYFCQHKVCYIVDLKKNTLFKTIEIDDCFANTVNGRYNMHLSIHPDKKLFSLCQCYGIALYDTATGTQQKKISLTFNPLTAESTMSPTHESVLFWNRYNTFVTKWDYNNNHVPIINMIPLSKVINVQCHPKKQEVFVQTEHYQNIYDHDEYTIIHEMHDNVILNSPIFTYSLDGSFAAYSEERSLDNYFIQIIDSNSHENISSIKYKNNIFKALAFHPNNAVLAMLSKQKETLQYFNIKQQKFIAETAIPHTDQNVCCPCIKFSPNGKQVIVKFCKSWILDDVPFEVIYKPKTKNFLPHLLFLLKNYKIDAYNSLPEDIVYLLANTTLENLKY